MKYQYDKSNHDKDDNIPFVQCVSSFQRKDFNEVNLVVNNQLYHILGGDINEEALGVMYFDTFSDRVWSEQ
ncbi:hypothetical protein MKY87_20775 [Paenibacillus sp. FSL R7-0198]|uniref:hypothetical protein n=1 Tax=Paenibacillus sp. FSL R7-0198 TaxID=2921674 RepID=UPI0030FD1AF4